MYVLPRAGSPTMAITSLSPCVPCSASLGGRSSCGFGLYAPLLLWNAAFCSLVVPDRSSRLLGRCSTQPSDMVGGAPAAAGAGRGDERGWRARVCAQHTDSTAHAFYLAPPALVGHMPPAIVLPHHLHALFESQS